MDNLLQSYRSAGLSDGDISSMIYSQLQNGTLDPDIFNGPTEPEQTPKNLATMQAMQAGADPRDLAAAKTQLGKKEYVGYCQAFVEQATQGRQSIYPTAKAAWAAQQGRAVSGLNGIKPGDPIYFTGNNDGHTGIVSGFDPITNSPKFISATDNGIEEHSVADWQAKTHQQPLGYIPQGGQQ